jgi:hypothetical protein
MMTLVELKTCDLDSHTVYRRHCSAEDRRGAAAYGVEKSVWCGEDMIWHFTTIGAHDIHLELEYSSCREKKRDRAGLRVLHNQVVGFHGQLEMKN